MNENTLPEAAAFQPPERGATTAGDRFGGFAMAHLALSVLMVSFAPFELAILDLELCVGADDGVLVPFGDTDCLDGKLDSAPNDQGRVHGGDKSHRGGLDLGGDRAVECVFGWR